MAGLRDQHDQAVAHIAAIIRGDDGSDQLAKDRTHGLSYSKLFLGKDSGTPSDVIPAADRIDVNTASGQQILALVANCISTYMGDLRFQHDEFGRFTGSPYDVFLRVNHLPVQPNGARPSRNTTSVWPRFWTDYPIRFLSTGSMGRSNIMISPSSLA